MSGKKGFEASAVKRYAEIRGLLNSRLLFPAGKEDSKASEWLVVGETEQICLG